MGKNKTAAEQIQDYYILSLNYLKSFNFERFSGLFFHKLKQEFNDQVPNKIVVSYWISILIYSDYFNLNKNRRTGNTFGNLSENH